MKRNLMTTAIVTLCLLGLAACATVGKDFYRTHVNDIRIVEIHFPDGVLQIKAL